MEIKISIIVPIYNVEKYLNEALDSIVEQDIEGIEIILINDGSTDKSTLIIEDYKEKYENIIVINQRNKGQSNARNKGIDIARGKYIYFFDSDDLLAKNSLNQLYKVAENNQIDLLLFSGKTFYDNDFKKKNSNTKLKFSYSKTASGDEILSGSAALKLLVDRKEYSPSPCLYLTRTNILHSRNLRFYEGIIHEDILFTLKLFLSCSSVKIIEDPFFYRRIRANSTMTSNDYKKKFCSLYIILLEIIELSTNSNNVNSNVVNELLSGVYGNLIRTYSYISNKNQKKYKKEIKQIKQIGSMNNFFERKDFWLFVNSEKLYSIFRKIFDFFIN